MKACHCIDCLCMLQLKDFPLQDERNLNLSQHHYTAVHKVKSTDELKRPTRSAELSPTIHYRELCVWPPCPTPGLVLTNALVDKWVEILTAMLQNLVKTLPSKVEAVTAAMGD